MSEIVGKPMEEEQSEVQAATGNETRIIQAECGEMNELESLCPQCEGNGTTRLMVTHIPHFREVIISSFECKNEECGERNNDVQFGGEFGPKHVIIELQVNDLRDLNRQVIKSEFATIFVRELELEIPPGSQKGHLNTVEGVLALTIQGLQHDQVVRKIMEPDVAAKIDTFCERLKSYQELKEPFTIILDDPAGNSYIEALYDEHHPTIDPKLKRSDRFRTDVERQMLGLSVENNTARTALEEQRVDDGQISDLVPELPLECPACCKPGVLRSHNCDIPYFKETLIMCFKCDVCGFKSTEVKNGGGVSPMGVRKVLTVVDSSDLHRDLLKSDSATVEIPEIQLELAAGTLGGFFTTVEGLLAQVHAHLSGVKQLAFDEGDSAAAAAAPLSSSLENCAVDGTPLPSRGGKMAIFLQSLKRLQEGNAFPFTVIMDDPLANIYIQQHYDHTTGLSGTCRSDESRLSAGVKKDPRLHSTHYQRTAVQDEDLGITALMAMEKDE